MRKTRAAPDGGGGGVSVGAASGVPQQWLLQLDGVDVDAFGVAMSALETLHLDESQADSARAALGV